jgi:6-phosphogluconolactonase/glucosamine-6-phosphate isomerase/deaminase
MKETDSTQLSTIRIFDSPIALGEAAAHEIASELCARLSSQPKARLIFAAAPSQSRMLHALSQSEAIDWADFNEAQNVRIVALADASRAQQVEERLFPAVEDVPREAITLSIPRLLRADRLYCCVSGRLKRTAVARAFLRDVSPQSPASILRKHPVCMVFLDTEAAAGLELGDR